MMDAEDDDDDMADLFSFGMDTEPPSPEPETVPTPTNNPTTPTKNITAADPMSEIEELFNDSDDSFLRMLDEHPVTPKDEGAGEGGTKKIVSNDPETEDIMKWLDEEDTDADALLAAVADESAQKAEEQKQKQEAKQKAAEEAKAAAAAQPPPAPVVPPAPVYESLEEVLQAPDSTKLQILEHWEQKEKCQLKDGQLRPLLWCRLIGGKSLGELLASSLADSFQAFIQQTAEDDNTTTVDQELQSWIGTEAAKLAPRVVRANPHGTTVTEAEEAIQSILLYHYHSNATKETNGGDAANNSTSMAISVQDPLLPPVVCAILSAGVPKLATPVLMSHLVPSFMPFVALTPEERWEASKLLHSQFYLLACYHLPMLVYHLDRYVPGWYWPLRPKADDNKNDEEKENLRNRPGNLQNQGVIPPSWLMTHLVGECGGTFLDPNRLLQLLDLVFTNENNSLRFFLVLAVLEQHSDSWLELTGKELTDSLTQHMQDSSSLTVEEWAARARAMKQATPDSVVDRLRTAEDEAVRVALKERQKRAEAALKARLEAEAAAHREAQERKAEEARTRLTRARLVAYYYKFNPSKAANIDKIMDTYKGRFEELDFKLKRKYGVGFNPALPPKKNQPSTLEAANESMKKTMASMNEGIKRMAEEALPLSVLRPDNPLNEHEDTDEIRKKEHRVSVSVKVGETLPYVCMTREQANDIRRVCLQKDLPMPLRFYLVDTRADEVAEQQGRFPTAARLTPETLLDPELLQKYEDSFEAVRGSFHICVMGEGHSAIPALYNQKRTPALEEYMRQDEARTNDCALFFVKRGFPFVSVLEGGFASAHAWLLREGPKKGLEVKHLLVDYDPDVSLFGQMEKIKKEQVGYKAQRALNALLEASLPTSNLEVEAGQNSDTTGMLQRKTSEDNAARGPLSFFGRRQQNAPANTTATSGDTAEAPAPGPGITVPGIGAGFFRRQQSAEGEKAGESANAPETPAAGPGITVPGAGFFRRQQVAQDKQPTENKSTEEGEKDESKAAAPTPPEVAIAPAAATAAPAPAPAPATAAQPQNRFSRWRQAAASAINANDELSQPGQGQPPAVGNRFGGAMGMLGRAVNQDNANNNAGNNRQQPLRRNPFARFGGGGAAGAGGGAPPGSEAAKAALTTASNAFGGLMKVAQNRPGFNRSASSDTGPDKPKDQQPQQQPPQQPASKVVSPPPRADEVASEGSSLANGDKGSSPNKDEPAIRAV